MEEALAQARLSLERGEVPIGAVVVFGGEVVTRAHWQGLGGGKLLEHPELMALLEADRLEAITRRRDRQQAALYTTLEPCALCIAAAMSFLLGRVVFALESPTDGAASLPELWKPAAGHPARGEPPYAVPAIVGGVKRAQSLELVQAYLSRKPQDGADWARTLIPSGSTGA